MRFQQISSYAKIYIVLNFNNRSILVLSPGQLLNLNCRRVTLTFDLVIMTFAQNVDLHQLFLIASRKTDGYSPWYMYVPHERT